MLDTLCACLLAKQLFSCRFQSTTFDKNLQENSFFCCLVLAYSWEITLLVFLQVLGEQLFWCACLLAEKLFSYMLQSTHLTRTCKKTVFLLSRSCKSLGKNSWFSCGSLANSCFDVHACWQKKICFLTSSSQHIWQEPARKQFFFAVLSLQIVVKKLFWCSCGSLANSCFDVHACWQKNYFLTCYSQHIWQEPARKQFFCCLVLANPSLGKNSWFSCGSLANSCFDVHACWQKESVFLQVPVTHLTRTCKKTVFAVLFVQTVGKNCFDVIAGPWRTAVLMCMRAGKKIYSCMFQSTHLWQEPARKQFFAVLFLQIVGKNCFDVLAGPWRTVFCCHVLADCWEICFDVLAGPWRTAVLMCMLAGKKNCFLASSSQHIWQEPARNSFCCLVLADCWEKNCFDVLAGPWRTAVLMCMLAGKNTVFLQVLINTFDKNLQENSFLLSCYLDCCKKNLFWCSCGSLATSCFDVHACWQKNCFLACSSQHLYKNLLENSFLLPCFCRLLEKTVLMFLRVLGEQFFWCACLLEKTVLVFLQVFPRAWFTPVGPRRRHDWADQGGCVIEDDFKGDII